jgi:hypothetical protein
MEHTRNNWSKLLDWLPAVMIILGLIWDASAAKEQNLTLVREVAELRSDMKEVREDVATLKGRLEK